MKPMYLLFKLLEGKPESSANGFIADILPSFDFIEDHIERQLEAFDAETVMEGGILIRSIGHTNTLNAQAKLLKYKQKNTSAVLFAACILVP